MAVVKSKVAIADDSKSAMQPLPELSRSAYKKVQFWDDSDWKTFATEQTAGVKRKTSARPRSEDGVLLYLEDHTGTPVNSARAEHQRFWVRTAFHDLLRRGIAAASYHACGAEAKSYVITIMSFWCPELRLCSNHWKINALATDVYPDWAQSNGLSKKQAQAIKVEDATPEPSKREPAPSAPLLPPPRQALAKRPAEPTRDMQPPLKKHKVRRYAFLCAA